MLSSCRGGAGTIGAGLAGIGPGVVVGCAPGPGSWTGSRYRPGDGCECAGRCRGSAAIHRGSTARGRAVQHDGRRAEFRRDHERAGLHGHGGDPVQPEGAYLSAGRIGAGQVPPSGMCHETVGQDGAVAAAALAVGVAECHRPLMTCGFAEFEQHPCFRGGIGTEARREVGSFQERRRPLPQRFGQYAPQLRRGTLARRGRRGGQPGPPAGRPATRPSRTARASSSSSSSSSSSVSISVERPVAGTPMGI